MSRKIYRANIQIKLSSFPSSEMQRFFTNYNYGNVLAAQEETVLFRQLPIDIYKHTRTRTDTYTHA